MANIIRLAKEFVLKVNSQLIARCTDYTLTIGAKIIDATTFDSEDWDEALRGTMNWSIAFSSLVTRDGTAGAPGASTGYGTGTFDSLFNQMVSNSYPFKVALGTQGTGSASGHTFSGLGIIEGLDFTGTVGEKISYKGNIKGGGKLEKV